MKFGKLEAALLVIFNLLVASPAEAQYQTPNHSVPIGRGAGVSGFGNAAPGTAGRPFVSNGALVDPSFQQLPNAGLAPGAANTFKGSLNGTTTADLPLVACTLAYQITQWVAGSGWQCGINPVLPSRAVAATLNLSAFSAVSTLGYASPGDGGRATFQKNSVLVDSYITSFTLVGGSGYTNSATYYGVQWSHSGKPLAIGTAAVVGGAITSANITFTPSASCVVGDVYTPSNIGPTGSGGSLTVTGCSTPLGSFVDTGSSKWQIVNEPVNNILQFGAINNGDSGAPTDNWSSIQAGLWFVGYQSPNAPGSGGGNWGGRMYMPAGSYMACGNGAIPLNVPNGVTFEGMSAAGSTLKMCSTYSTSTQFITLCDLNWHFACFSSMITRMQIWAPQSATASGNAYMVFTNNDQDHGGLYDVNIIAGQRGCVWFTSGFGGAATVYMEKIECSTNSSLAQIRIGDTVDNFGSTYVVIKGLSLGGASSGGTYQTGPGVAILGGLPVVERVHCESMPICVQSSNSTAGLIGSLSHINGGSGAPAPACTGVIQLDNPNQLGNLLISNVQAGSCTNTITNNQAGAVSGATLQVVRPVVCTTTCT